jgi:hypothetical protein
MTTLVPSKSAAWTGAGQRGVHENIGNRTPPRGRHIAAPFSDAAAA